MRTVIVPDLQVPYHDVVAVKNVSSFIKSYQPDRVVTLGDEIDLPQISRWNEHKSGWFEQTLDDDRNLTVEVLWELTQYSTEAHMVRSNHTDRLFNVIASKIPAFMALPELRFEKFLKLDELGIQYHKTPLSLSKDIIAVHGDEQGINPHAGMTALGAARRHGKSVICGHTHRAGQSAFTEASGGKIGRILRGWDAGHLMDVRKAHYTKGTMNWQQAFLIMEEIGKNVQVTIIHLEKDGTFIVHGKCYGRAR
jgi:predicted phosphodiesterase